MDVFLLEGQVGIVRSTFRFCADKRVFLLLDTGCAEHVDNLILPGFATLGILPLDLRFVINTHPDSDHVGGNAGIKRWSPRALLCCGDADRKLIDDPSELFRYRYDAYRQYGVFYSGRDGEKHSARPWRGCNRSTLPCAVESAFD